MTIGYIAFKSVVGGAAEEFWELYFDKDGHVAKAVGGETYPFNILNAHGVENFLYYLVYKIHKPRMLQSQRKKRFIFQRVTKGGPAIENGEFLEYPSPGAGGSGNRRRQAWVPNGCCMRK